MFFHSTAWWYLFLTIFLATTNGHGGDEHHESHNLLIVSFDGFRWDYLSRTHTPNFDWIKNRGVSAKHGIKNAFLTKTLPNHFTIVTGLWEESHGIVGNTMYDPDLQETFVVTNQSQMRASRWWDVGAEPIWVTNQRQKNNGRSGCVMWTGCEAPIKGITPTYHIPYDRSVSNSSRVELIVDWFTQEYPINLGLLYFDEPDRVAHQFGPESEEVTAMISALDEIMGELLQKLNKSGLLESMNIIVTSDHGFTTVSKQFMVNLDDYIRPDSYTILSSNPVAAILPLHNDTKLTEEIYINLTQAARHAGAHFDVYKKENIPIQYHFTDSRRIMPIIVVAHENYSIAHNGSIVHYRMKGEHGYNNSLPDMHPFFLATGPSFQHGGEVDTFNNVDIYPLMCHLLSLRPAPNNGSMDVVRALLKKQKEEEETTFVTFGTYFFVLLVIASVGGVFLVAACRQHRYLKRMQRKRVISMPGGVKYSLPPANGAKEPLLSETEEEDF